MKPYLYGGLALLIVGLFSVVYAQNHQLKATALELEVATGKNIELSLRVEDLKDSVKRKEGAILAYNQIDSKLNGFVNRATKIILGYAKRDTDDEKCLDRTPPTELLRLLREDYLRGQGSVHSPK